MGNVKKWNEFKKVNESGKSISNKELYQERRDEGDSPDKAAEFVLDIMTTGIWAGWDEDKIEKMKSEIIAKFEESEDRD